MSKEKSKEQRPEAYPKPSETDKQLDNQDEFLQPLSDKINVEEQILKEDGQVNKTQKKARI